MNFKLTCLYLNRKYVYMHVYVAPFLLPTPLFFCLLIPRGVVVEKNILSFQCIYTPLLLNRSIVHGTLYYKLCMYAQA